MYFKIMSLRKNQISELIFVPKILAIYWNTLQKFCYAAKPLYVSGNISNKLDIPAICLCDWKTYLLKNARVS